MIVELHHEPDTACRKRRYRTRRDALRGVQSGPAHGRPLYPYLCPECPWWHLTSRHSTDLAEQRRKIREARA